uniref:5',3'-nucleotidase, mitochondrial n=1 Tax=Oncorhynchus mykiss TaxID=8022 RepID=A0A8C7W6E9_ONCMY
MSLLPKIVTLRDRGRILLHDQFKYISAKMSSSSGKRLRVLVDMDGVIADFEGGFLKKYRARYPNEPYITLEDRRGFWVSSQYGNLRSDLCVSSSELCILSEKGKYPYIKCLTDVFICTSPIKHYIHCPGEKYAWIEKHLGYDFLDQIILTRDKTVVTGDVLIDDKPDILGESSVCSVEPNPSWEHILFTACHNKHILPSSSHRRLLSWADDWRGILENKRL